VLNKFSCILLVAFSVAFAGRRLLSYLRYFQQEEYNQRRFVAWIKRHNAVDTRGTIALVVSLMVGLLFAVPWAIFLSTALCCAALLAVSFFYEEDPRRSGKLKLNMTERAKKIHLASWALLLLIVTPIALLMITFTWSAVLLYALTALFAIVIVQTPPLLLIASNNLLAPLERRIQDFYYRDAKRVLAEVDPFIIGITGSYGKTGAKAALADLLSRCVGPTFWPRKSINTVMGITRTIREELKPYHKLAVIEMGAYNIGSISRLCEFTPPKAALVTAVGIMHLERFGSEENVYKAKSEIAQGLPDDGILVCNGDSPGARRMARQYDRATTLLYGLDLGCGHLDCHATDLSFDEQGSTFTINWNGHSFAARTPLLGRPAVSNILGAFTLACALGADPEYAVACIASLEPVDNRLVLDKSAGVSFLRDAYNSNPTGFASALEVLDAVKATRRILMTPGMIELGEKQYEENRRVAALAAAVCDVVIVVGKANRDALLAGLQDADYNRDNIRVVSTRDEAFQVLSEMQARGDLVLLENDLPDLHENKVRF
jgi:UDP-N-acetylmuramoyl-tripeptide--D-alanyl-D-alanine ligase